MRGSNIRRVIGWACQFFCALLLAGLFGGAVRAADIASTPTSSVPLGLPFAISDFDGDSRVDLATVTVGQTHFSNAEYWIQLQLSAAGQQSIHLVAPVGGLQIVARDVNGDKALDLIVSTAWSNRPVAVYLNDGHGGFKHSDPSEFLGIFEKTSAS